MRRSLLYHIYPVAGNGVWQWNVEQMRQRLNLFDGRRVVAIATDDSTDSPAAVQEAFGGSAGIDWIIRANDPRLGQTATWGPLWERVQGTDGVTFYGHAKGVRYPPGHHFSAAVKAWTWIMLEVCLDFWSMVAERLRSFPIAGPFKIESIRRYTEGRLDGPFILTPELWHYSGCFYWVRNRDVFSRDWWRFEVAEGGRLSRAEIESAGHEFLTGYYSTEHWPGMHFAWDDGADLFNAPAFTGAGQLYDCRYTVQALIPAYQKWKAARGGQRRLEDIHGITAPTRHAAEAPSPPRCHRGSG